MNTNNYALEVKVNGKNITKLSHEGKFFIEGRDGSEYTIKVSNNTYKRVMAIISLDGINVIDGKAATADAPGYLVRPYSSVEIKGYRESDTSVGAFKFIVNKGTYAKDVTGSTQHCGVIGCMIVDEKIDHVKAKLDELSNKLDQLDNKVKTPYFPYYSWNMAQPYHGDYATCNTLGILGSKGSPGFDGVTTAYRCASDSAIASSAVNTFATTYTSSINMASMQASGSASTSQSTKASAKAEFDLGSTWGQRLYDKVETVAFDRGNILETLEIYYASRDNLEAMGVPVVQKKNIAFPSAFPGYCKPPQNYRG